MGLASAARVNAILLLAALGGLLFAELTSPFGSSLTGGTTFYDPTSISTFETLVLNAAAFLKGVVIFLIGTGLSLALLVLARLSEETR